MGFMQLVQCWRRMPAIIEKESGARPTVRTVRLRLMHLPSRTSPEPASAKTTAALVSLGLAAFSAFAIAGCGGSTDSADATCQGDCTCSGSTCSCKTGGTCSFGPAPLTDDAGASTVDPGALPNDVTYHCDAKGSCDLTCGSSCTSTCAGRSTCAGACTSNCTSTCAGTSQCTLQTGTNSSVTCTGGSTCTLTLDTGSSVTCDGNSSCEIHCPKGGCTAQCQGSTSCSVECGGTTACTIQCNGGRTQECAAGSTCANACEATSG